MRLEGWLFILAAALILTLLSACDQPLPPDEALAECIRAGGTPRWMSSLSHSTFDCELRKPVAPARSYLMEENL